MTSDRITSGSVIGGRFEIERLACAGGMGDVFRAKDQRTGERTRGFVKRLLTSAPYHSRGIKVMLDDGEVGRVVEIIDEATE